MSLPLFCPAVNKKGFINLRRVDRRRHMLGGISSQSTRVFVSLFGELIQSKPDSLVAISFVRSIQWNCAPFSLQDKTGKHRNGKDKAVSTQRVEEHNALNPGQIYSTIRENCLLLTLLQTTDWYNTSESIHSYFALAEAFIPTGLKREGVTDSDNSCGSITFTP